MAQITRSTKVGGGTTLQSNTLARAADVETDVLTLFNAHNNHDTAASSWTAVSALGSTTVPLTADNSSGTQNIANFKDNGTTVVSVADGGAVAIAAASSAIVPLTVTSANGGSAKTAIFNNGTSTGNIVEFQDNGTAAWSVADGGNLVSNSKKITGMANGTAATDGATFGQIKTGVQAVVQATGTTSTNITSNVQTSTVITASITPTSASNRIRVTVTFTISTDTSSGGCLVSLLRGASDISGGASGFQTFGNASTAWRTGASLSYIDSPATTSSTTYTLTGTNVLNAGTVAIGTGRLWVMQLEEIV